MNPQIEALTAQAVAELQGKRSDGRSHANSKRRLEVASSIQQALAELNGGDEFAVTALYLVFAPRSDWDEVGGSAELGIQLSELLYPLWVAVR